MNVIFNIILILVGLTVGFIVSQFLESRKKSSANKKAQNKAKHILSEAEREGERIKKDKIFQAKEKFLELKAEHEKAIIGKERKANEIIKRSKEKERRLSQELEKSRRHSIQLDEKRQGLNAKIGALKTKQEEVDKLKNHHVQQLEKLSNTSAEDAKRELIDALKDKAKTEAMVQIKLITDEATLTAQKEAKKIIVQTIQRIGTEEAIENSVTTFNLESDDLKGKIIGREGRNIRALEEATGVEILVDDTPEAIILSCFDPVRREIARLSLHRLVTDGRIHPARIEEVVTKTKKQIGEEIIEVGKRTIIDLGIHGLHPELVRIVGRMKYRSSYGQNLLQHSKEVAKLCSVMAAELGLDTKAAKRAGLLHDIGKVAEEESDLPHALLGMQWAEKYREKPEVLNAIGAHHDEIEMTGLISPIVQVCDAISGARPGARHQLADSYIKRLKDLENLALTFDGVQKAYAIQAGRELRVFVESEKVSDEKASQISFDISNKIQTDMTYPGQVKVTVIREIRAVSIAK